MIGYSGLLIMMLNRRTLPEPIEIGGVRAAALVLSTLLFGCLSTPTLWQQLPRLFG